MSKSLGDIFETVARNIDPEAPSVLCDGKILTWSEFDQASNALGRRLLDVGLGLQAKVGLYMRNSPDYLIAFAACVKARLCPFNINYRYGPEEVAYLLDNADCEALIFDCEFAQVVTAIPSTATLRLRISAHGAATGAELISKTCAGNGEFLEISRDPDDLILLYTGGTTGLPKGVMWTSGIVWENLLPGLALPGKTPPRTLEALGAQIYSGEGRYRVYIAPPLMHGTGLVAALGALFRGGSVVLSGRPSFDPERMLQEVQDLHCVSLSIVGEAFARPLLDVLRGAPGRFDVSHVLAVTSSGMMWSPETKLGLLEFMPKAQLVDALSASEAPAFATMVTTRDSAPKNVQFQLTGAVVLRPEDLTPIRPGYGEVGVIAKAGILPLPLGYYKDPERTARTYVMINGVRHMVGGDHATVEADGSIRLLGRGSHCINTGGEKVYPEEVEEALKTHSEVRDALVFGIPDPRFGQTVAAVVSTRKSIPVDELDSHVRNCLAGYKVPRRIVLVGVVPRGPNGKADYSAARFIFEGH